MKTLFEGIGRQENESKLSFILRAVKGGYTYQGVVEWFDRPRTKLSGKTPAQAIDEGNIDEVVKLANELQG